MEKIVYSDILLKARLVRALIGNHKMGAAKREAREIQEQLGALVDAEYKTPPELVTCSSDPMDIVNSMIAVGECAHPISMELAAKNLCTLLDQIVGDVEEEKAAASNAEVAQ
jgi:hypothetical protein